MVTGVFKSPLLLLLFASLTFAMLFCCVLTLGRLSVGWPPLDVIIVADAVMIEVVDELLLQLLEAILDAILLLQFLLVTDALLLELLLELFSDVLLLLLLLLFELLLFAEIVVTAADG